MRCCNSNDVGNGFSLAPSCFRRLAHFQVPIYRVRLPSSSSDLAIPALHRGRYFTILLKSVPTFPDEREKLFTKEGTSMSQVRQHQRGYIFLKGASWYLRYRQYEIQANGSQKLVQRCRKLADNQGLYRSKKTVKTLALEFLAPLNNGTMTGASCMSVAEFWEKEYLPYVTEHKKPSTVCSYKHLWNAYLKDTLALHLRDFHTVDCERMLQGIARQGDYSLRPESMGRWEAGGWRSRMVIYRQPPLRWQISNGKSAL